MTLKECYEKLGGDYENAVSRLMNDNLVEKFIFKFLDDSSFDDLRKALENKDYDEAFRAAHTIKGVCQNLSFTTLFNSANKLTDELRNGKKLENTDLFKAVEIDYNKTVSAIKLYKQEL